MRSVFLLSILGFAAIQEPQIVFGQVYTCKARDNSQFKVVSCDARNMCATVIVNAAHPEGGDQVNQPKGSLLSLIKDGRCEVEATPVPPAGTPAPPAVGAPPATVQTTVPAPGGNALAGGGPMRTAGPVCESDPGLTPTPNPNDTRDMQFKRAILEEYETRKRPRPVGMKISQVTIGASYRNNPQEPLSFVATAPANATIYPVKVTMDACQKFADGEVIRERGLGSYLCFIDAFNQIRCGSGSGAKLTTVRERRP